MMNSFQTLLSISTCAATIWWPQCDVVMYDGAKDSRKAMCEEKVNGQRFNVLLTHYDLAMHDKNSLSKVGWCPYEPHVESACISALETEM